MWLFHIFYGCFCTHACFPTVHVAVHLAVGYVILLSFGGVLVSNRGGGLVSTVIPHPWEMIHVAFQAQNWRSEAVALAARRGSRATRWV